MYYLLIAYNIMVLCLFGADKLFAIKNKWRISENVLLLVSLFMGAAGGLFGMFLFSHKTRKLKFTLIMPVLLVLNVICLKVLL